MRNALYHYVDGKFLLTTLLIISVYLMDRAIGIGTSESNKSHHSIIRKDNSQDSEMELQFQQKSINTSHWHDRSREHQFTTHHHCRRVNHYQDDYYHNRRKGINLALNQQQEGGSGMSVTFTNPSSISKILFVLLPRISESILSAYIGTLRLLAPLIVSRRMLVEIGDFFVDYMRGRYFRRTYSRLERVYIRYYELPAAFRAISRTISEIITLIFLAEISNWIIPHFLHSCYMIMGSSQFFLSHNIDTNTDHDSITTACALIWLVTVVGIGKVILTAISVWGGPIRVQAKVNPKLASVWSRLSGSHTRTHRIILDLLFSRPFSIFQFQWNRIKKSSSSSPLTDVDLLKHDTFYFDPNPIFFPATWVPLQLLQFYAMARILSTDPSNYTTWKQNNNVLQNRIPKLIRLFLVQISMNDEWYRVFIGEKRCGLGVFVLSIYGSTLTLFFIQCAMMNIRVSIIFILPSLCAFIMSLWMNLVIFWNRNRMNANKTDGSGSLDYWHLFSLSLFNKKD